MLVEIFNKDGVKVLDSSTKILKATQRRFLSGSDYVHYSFRPPANAVWLTDEYGYGRIDMNDGDLFFYASNPYLKGDSFKIGAMTWVRPLSGSGVLHRRDQISWQDAFAGYPERLQVNGGGIHLVNTELVTANDASGYLDCFNDKGELVWSLSSLLKVPQILRVIPFDGTTGEVSLNLNDFPAHMREKLFFNTNYAGSYVPYENSSMGERYALLGGILFRRVNNIVKISRKFSTISPQGIGVVYVAYIPD